MQSGVHRCYRVFQSSGNLCLQQLRSFNSQIELAAAGLCPPVRKGRGKGQPPPPPPPKGKGRGTLKEGPAAAPRGRGLGALGEDIQSQLSQGLEKITASRFTKPNRPLVCQPRPPVCHLLPQVSWLTLWLFLRASPPCGHVQRLADPRRSHPHR